MKEKKHRILLRLVASLGAYSRHCSTLSLPVHVLATLGLYIGMPMLALSKVPSSAQFTTNTLWT